MVRSKHEVLTSQDKTDRQFLIMDRYGRPIINDEGEEIIGAPVDIHSITKRELGKMWYGAEIAIGAMQLMHPQISAAVEHTQKFKRNPYGRVAVSLDPIMAVVYADNQQEAGSRVQNFHKNIHGADYKGRKFNALDRDAYYWAHDTFVYGVENLAEHYSTHPFTREDKEQVHLESNTWYSFYRMPMGMVPADYETKLAYRKDIVDNVLEMTPAAERIISMALDRHPPRPEAVPKPVWLLAKMALLPITEVMSTLSIGELPEDIRQKFDIPFPEREQKQLRDIRTIVKTLDGIVPDPLKYLTVYDSFQHERGGKHKNIKDRIIYMGNKAVANTVGNGVAAVRSIQSKNPRNITL